MIFRINRQRLTSFIFTGRKTYKGIRVGDIAFVPYDVKGQTYSIVVIRDIDVNYGIFHCYNANLDRVIPYTYELIIQNNKYLRERNK